ncbi:MAG: hypothetical protein IPG45_24175 [Deltaproteobacteria bacterium]|nr:hypothetical protein [Deltaproteobacteria bacterium]
MGRRPLFGLGDPEVEQLDAGDRGQVAAQITDDHHVVGLQIPMHDLPLVDGLERARDLQDHVARLQRRKRRAPQPLAQGRSVQQLHHTRHSARFVQLHEVEDVDDVRVTNVVGDLRLVVKPREHTFVVGELGAEHLDRGAAIEPSVGGRVDVAHAARGDPLFEAVTPDDLAEVIGDPVVGDGWFWLVLDHPGPAGVYPGRPRGKRLPRPLVQI